MALIAVGALWLLSIFKIGDASVVESHYVLQNNRTFPQSVVTSSQVISSNNEVNTDLAECSAICAQHPNMVCATNSSVCLIGKLVTDMHEEEMVTSYSSSIISPFLTPHELQYWKAKPTGNWTSDVTVVGEVIYVPIRGSKKALSAFNFSGDFIGEIEMPVNHSPMSVTKVTGRDLIAIGTYYYQNQALLVFTTPDLAQVTVVTPPVPDRGDLFDGIASTKPSQLIMSDFKRRRIYILTVTSTPGVIVDNTISLANKPRTVAGFHGDVMVSYFFLELIERYTEDGTFVKNYALGFRPWGMMQVGVDLYVIDGGSDKKVKVLESKTTPIVPQNPPHVLRGIAVENNTVVIAFADTEIRVYSLI